MKTQVEFLQGNDSLSFNFNLDKTNLDLIVGTSVRRLYELVNVAKFTGARVINLSKPVDVIINVDGKVYTETISLNERLRNRVKINRKKQKTFALRLKALLEFAMSEIEVVSVNELKDAE